MPSEKLVLVIGAGASKEFGLPTGWELKDKIARFLSCKVNHPGTVKFVDSRAQGIYEELKRRSHSTNAAQGYFDAANAISKNMAVAPSIDNFLDTHRADTFIVELGKASIAQLITAGEAESKLFVSHSNSYNTLDLESVSQTWLGLLFSRLVAQRDFSSFEAKIREVKFISFNYDRVIQQFFWYAVQSYFRKSPEDAMNLVNLLDIEYVYGSVGTFSQSTLGFTSFGSINDVLGAAKSIRTFTEGSSENFQSTIANKIQGAKGIMFLGFGFLELNIEALFANNQFEIGPIYGTGKGLSQTTVLHIKNLLASRLLRRKNENYTSFYETEQIRIVDKTCSEFMFEFERVF